MLPDLNTGLCVLSYNWKSNFKVQIYECSGLWGPVEKFVDFLDFFQFLSEDYVIADEDTMSVSVRPKKKAERRSVLAEYWSRPSSTAAELDIVDRGDRVEVKSCSADVAAWWLGTLRAMYPQDHYSGSGENLKMHPAMGVTLKLNRNDGTLTIKGKKHFQWFKENFEQVLESGNKEFNVLSEMGKVIDKYLQIDDGFTVGLYGINIPYSP